MASAPKLHGYDTFPIDSTGFWGYREKGTLVLDRAADAPE